MRKTALLLLALCFVFAMASCKAEKGEEFTVALADTGGMEFYFEEEDVNTDPVGEVVATIDLGTGEVTEPAVTTEQTTVATTVVTTEQTTVVTTAATTVATTAKEEPEVEAPLEITKGGTYTLTGTKNDVMIVVDVGDSDVQLVLNNLTITNSKGPAIYIRSADKVMITLAVGSVNTLSDGSDYTYTDETRDVDATLFSRADLTVNGSGKLIVNGNAKHAIVSKDDLIISSGTLEITAKNVGLCGKDCVKINSGDIKINAGSDGIRSDNSEDASRGYIYLYGGNIDITAGNDGIQAETVVNVEDVNLNINAGGGSSHKLADSSESFKGIKAVSDILIKGGKFNIDSKDDCIHSNGTVTIEGGSYTLSSGDDGIHADTDLAIYSGNLSILKSYEGVEATNIVISGGNVEITASDDGLNAAGGNDGNTEFGGGMRPGKGFFSSSTGTVKISGGYIVVNASGDGIDSNGTVTVSGGTVLVSGPQSGANGAFDYDSTAVISGGVFVALGSSGMAQNFTTAENQSAVLVGFSSQSGGESFALCDASGKAIVSFVPAKNYTCAVVSAPELQSGNGYSIVVGADVSGADKNGYARNASYTGGTEITTFTVNNAVERIGVSGGMGGMRPGGNGGFPQGEGAPFGEGNFPFGDFEVIMPKGEFPKKPEETT